MARNTPDARRAPRGYLAEAFGGPPLYSGGFGDESAMLRVHAGRGRWCAEPTGYNLNSTKDRKSLPLWATIGAHSESA